MGWLSGVISCVSSPSYQVPPDIIFVCCYSVHKHLHGSHSQMSSVLQDFLKAVGFSQAASPFPQRSPKEVRVFYTFLLPSTSLKSQFHLGWADVAVISAHHWWVWLTWVSFWDLLWVFQVQVIKHVKEQIFSIVSQLLSCSSWHF